MHVFGAVVKNKVNGASEICTLPEREICAPYQWRQSCPAITCCCKVLWRSTYHVPNSLASDVLFMMSLTGCSVFFSRAPSFIYDAGAGLGEGFDIIKGPYDHDGDLEYGLYHISFLSLYDSLSSCSSFSFYLSLFFIYLYNVHRKTKNIDIEGKHKMFFSHDKGSRSTSRSNCSGVTLWTEHHLFTLLISRKCNVYRVLEIWSGIDLTWEQLSRPDSGLFNRNESRWLFGNGHCKCCLVLGEGLCWVIASGPNGYQVKATWWQAGWWFAPENEKVITVSGSVKY